MSSPPFYDPARAPPTFKLLFAELWNLIFTSITKMGIFAPDGCGPCGRNLKDIFDMKMPAFADDADAGAISVEERHLVSPVLMAYSDLKWLIYTAAFKEPLADARGATYAILIVNTNIVHDIVSNIAQYCVQF